MKNHKNEKIDIACIYCEYATVTRDAQEDILIECPKKKNITPQSRCRKFRYDPLKREVRAAHGFVPLDPDALLMD